MIYLDLWQISLFLAISQLFLDVWISIPTCSNSSGLARGVLSLSVYFSVWSRPMTSSSGALFSEKSKGGMYLLLHPFPTLSGYKSRGLALKISPSLPPLPPSELSLWWLVFSKPLWCNQSISILGYLKSELKWRLVQTLHLSYLAHTGLLWLICVKIICEELTNCELSLFSAFSCEVSLSIRVSTIYLFISNIPADSYFKYLHMFTILLMPLTIAW